MKLTKEDLNPRSDIEPGEYIRLDKLREAMISFLDEYDGDDSWFFERTFENLITEVLE